MKTPLEIAREQVALLERQEREAKEARIKAARPVFKYTVSPVTHNWTKIFAPGFRMVHLWREATNLAELKAIGYPDHGLSDGIDYLFSERDRVLVCHTGGGLVLLQEERHAYAIGEFLANNPNGGDVTHLMV